MKKPKYFRLEGQEPVPLASLNEWLEHCLTRGDVSEQIARDENETHCVSTVFMGFENGYDQLSRPLVFETMVLSMDRALTTTIRRAATWDDAMALHANAVAIFLHGESS